MTTTQKRSASNNAEDRINKSFGAQTSPINRFERRATLFLAMDRAGLLLLDSEEDDPLVCDKVNRSANIGGKNNYDSFEQPESDRPESESQLSIRHLSESGK